MITVAPGEIVAVVGHDGWPVRIARQLAAASTGRVGHVEAGRPIFASLTVAENLAVGAYRERRDRPLVAERRATVLARFPRLGERLGQRAGTLSGGEAQLLVIARALMGAPELLILEAPSAGLAPRAIEAVANALRELTVVIADESLALARHADRVVLVEHGEITLDADRATALADLRLGVDYFTGAARKIAPHTQEW